MKLHFFFSRRSASVTAAVMCIIISAVGVLLGMRVASVSRTNAGISSVPLILIDAGHGGEDGGATTVGGLLEKEVNLNISMQLRDILRLMGYRVRMTRETDISLHTDANKRKRSDLEARLDAINARDVTLCVSIHQNSYVGGSARGTQVFYAPNGANSEALAAAVQQSVISMLQPENTRATKRADSSIFILNNAQKPAVLVECLFMSDPRDVLLLSKQKERSKLAFAIACGIAEYLEG